MLIIAAPRYLTHPVNFPCRAVEREWVEGATKEARPHQNCLTFSPPDASYSVHEQYILSATAVFLNPCIDKFQCDVPKCFLFLSIAVPEDGDMVGLPTFRHYG